MRHHRLQAKILVSIHAPREGCDYREHHFLKSVHLFQFTHPGRGATTLTTCVVARLMFQFTHPGRGATRFVSP